MALLAEKPIQGWIYILELMVWVEPSALRTVNEIRAEVSDRKWLNHPHGRRTTYKKGCHGPLCRKAMRDYGRKYQRRVNGHTRERTSPHQKFDTVIVSYQNLYNKWKAKEDGRGTSDLGDAPVLEVNASA